jgi:SAM-dependent methyltransferase
VTGDQPATPAPDWAATSGDIWARRWRDTDAALEPLSPHLLSTIVGNAPAGPFRAFEIGCGPGSTTTAVADACPGATIIACDISPALAAIAEQRTAGRRNVRVVTGDAEAIASSEGPFDLIFSRHGIMFFADPVRAFRALRNAANPGAALVFSCFQNWDLNPWASEVAAAAAGRVLPKPGREPSGFAFADPDYVREIFRSSGWANAEPEAVEFQYVAAEGPDEALSFVTELGPASRILQAMPEEERGDATERMRAVVDSHFNGTAVVFPAAAWIWRATAA